MLVANVIRFLVLPDRLIELTAEDERFAQHSASERKCRVQLHGFTELCDRLRVTPRQDIAVTQIGVNDERKRIEFDRAFQLGDSMIVFPSGERTSMANQ